MREALPLPQLFTGVPVALADARDLTAVFRAFADPSRLQLLSLLHAYGEQTQHELWDGLNRLTQPTVAHHLRILDEAGLVVRTKRGVFVMHRIQPAALEMVAAAVRPGGGQ